MAQGYAPRKKRVANEHAFQMTVSQYLDLALDSKLAAGTSHESNMPLGLLPLKPTDSAIRQACIKFYNNIVGGVLKSMAKRGFKKGWADNLIHYRHVQNNQSCSIWFELKSKGGRIQPHQQAHADHLNTIGVPTVFPRNLEDVKNALIKYGVPHRDVQIIS